MRKLGERYTILYPGEGQDYLEFIRRSVYNQQKKYPWAGIPEIDDEWDGVYATQLPHKLMLYNSTDSVIKKNISIDNPMREIEFEISIEPYSIVSVDI